MSDHDKLVEALRFIAEDFKYTEDRARSLANEALPLARQLIEERDRLEEGIVHQEIRLAKLAVENERLKREQRCDNERARMNICDQREALQSELELANEHCVVLSEENERLKKEKSNLEVLLGAAEDFRAEIVIDAFTAPDADWNTILDSLRSRIADTWGRVKRAEEVVEAAKRYRDRPLLERLDALYDAIRWYGGGVTPDQN